MSHLYKGNAYMEKNPEEKLAGFKNCNQLPEGLVSDHGLSTGSLCDFGKSQFSSC